MLVDPVWSIRRCLEIHDDLLTAYRSKWISQRCLNTDTNRFFTVHSRYSALLMKTFNVYFLFGGSWNREHFNVSVLVSSWFLVDGPTWSKHRVWTNSELNGFSRVEEKHCLERIVAVYAKEIPAFPSWFFMPCQLALGDAGGPIVRTSLSARLTRRKRAV